MDSGTKIIRIGDRIDRSSFDGRKSFFGIYENLSIRIFDPNLKKEKIKEFYVNSPSTISPDESLKLKPIFHGLGDYERFLTGKLVNPPRKVILLIGQMGGGKTTTLTYLIDRLINLGCEGCEKGKGCSRDNKSFVLNLNEEKFQTNDEIIAKKILNEELTIKIRGRLNLIGKLSLEDELTIFWNKQFEKLRKDFSGLASFIWITSELSDLSDLHSTDNDFPKRFQDRKQVFEELKTDKSLYFDYLIHLWGYEFEEFYNKACSFIVFDNIDKATPIVQSMLVSILDDCSDDPGPNMIVSLRPETRERFGLGRNKGSVVMDIVNHDGLKASAVLLDRLIKFIDQPENYFDENDGMTRSEFGRIQGYLTKVYNLIKPDPNNNSTYLSFIDDACGKSSRLALLCAENLLKINIDEMKETTLSSHSLIRTTVINQAYAKFKGSVRSPIPNLFQVRDYRDDGLLIKTRLLRYLRNSEKNSNSQNNIRRSLKGFGYPETSLIKDVIEEMQNIYCQLIRSDGFDFYQSDHEFLMAGNQKITLTEIGVGYIDNILFTMDYIQEVILDCRLPKDWANQEFGFSGMAEKFGLVVKFLRYLLDVDIQETQAFCSFYNRKVYCEHFNSFLMGDMMISVEIIYKTYKAMKRILDSIKPEASSDVLSQLQNVLEEYRNLLILAGNKNLEIIGVYPYQIENEKSLYS